MANKPISGLTAAGSFILADELEVNEAGTTKKATGTQMQTAILNVPTVPTVVAVTAEFSAAAGVPSATLPTGHTTNDILVLVLESLNDVVMVAPTGYKQVGPQNGVWSGGGACRLGTFWKRDGGSESAPTIPNLGDHTYGFMFAVRGCPTVGDPILFGGNNWKYATSTSGTSCKSTTTCDDVLVVDIFANAVTGQTTGQGSSGANSDLSSFTAQFNDNTTDGNDGGLYMSSGIKSVAGEVKATTLTWSNTTREVSNRLHFLPADFVQLNPAGRGNEIQIFVGSENDLDDLWVKPYMARRVFVQLIDGGGSGSGGNTATTAAGGGGGGGGGYDEAWFNADDLASTITVHAGKGAAAGTALNQAGNAGVISEFNKAGVGGLSSLHRIAGAVATAAASADGGNGGSGSGRGLTSPAVATTRIDLTAATAGAALGGVGGRGGSGTTSPTGGSPAEWGGGGGESGADTDAATTSVNNGWSLRGGGGGSGGRTNTNISGSGAGGGAAGVISAQGATGGTSTRLPFGGSGGVGGGSSVVTGGPGGFPGGGGGGGAGVAGGFGGAGGHGCIVVTTFF